MIPNGEKFDLNPTSFGIAFEKKNGKTFVAGLWENNATQQYGITVGDEVLKINSIDTNQLSRLDLIALSLSKQSNTMTMEYKNKGKIHSATLRKEKYLPEIQ